MSDNPDKDAKLAKQKAKGASITDADIRAADIPRRGFLRGLGMVFIGTAAVGCEKSDGCDSDTGDPIDSDPTDSIDSDSGDNCDTD